MKSSNFMIQTDENEIRYISKRDDLTKNNREDKDESSNRGIMYEIP